MSSGTNGSLWRRFEHDPRDPAYSAMRASDRDRAVVHDVIAEAYAEGRLDRDELDERTTVVDAAKTYADLLPPIRDLTADVVPTRFAASAPVAPPDVRRSAEQYYRGQLRDSFFGLLVPNLICWTIWYLTGHDGFLWPLFVTIPTVISFLKLAGSRERIVEGRIAKLQRRQARALQPGSEPGTSGEAGPILSEEEKPEQA